MSNPKIAVVFGTRPETIKMAPVVKELERDVRYRAFYFDPVNAKRTDLGIIVNPLVNWIWTGFGLLAIGTGIALLPETVFAFAAASSIFSKRPSRNWPFQWSGVECSLAA